MVEKWQTDSPEQPVLELPTQRVGIGSRRWSPGYKLVGFAILLLVCMCSLFSFYAQIMVEGVTDNAVWENRADQFMQAMRDGEIVGAYRMFAPAAEEEVPLSKLQELAADSKYVLFDGYRALELESWEVTRNLEGTFATAERPITYSGGYTGRWTFTFIEVEEEWKIYSFHVWVPWDKIDAFKQP